MKCYFNDQAPKQLEMRANTTDWQSTLYYFHKLLTAKKNTHKVCRYILKC